MTLKCQPRPVALLMSIVMVITGWELLQTSFFFYFVLLDPSRVFLLSYLF